MIVRDRPDRVKGDAYLCVFVDLAGRRSPPNTLRIELDILLKDGPRKRSTIGDARKGRDVLVDDGLKLSL